MIIIGVEQDAMGGDVHSQVHYFDGTILEGDRVVCLQNFLVRVVGNQLPVYIEHAVLHFLYCWVYYNMLSLILSHP